MDTISAAAIQFTVQQGELDANLAYVRDALTPSSVWNLLPSLRPKTSCLMASGWDPAAQSRRPGESGNLHGA